MSKSEWWIVVFGVAMSIWVWTSYPRYIHVDRHLMKKDSGYKQTKSIEDLFISN